MHRATCDVDPDEKVSVRIPDRSLTDLSVGIEDQVRVHYQSATAPSGWNHCTLGSGW